MSDEPSAAGFRERYFRGIADRFIALRGAPFSLSPADICLIEAWESAGIPLDCATDDGSFGFAGFVTALLERALEGGRPDGLFACGPDAMMKRTGRMALGLGLPAQLSLEAVMGCGFGACWGCVHRIKKDDGGQWRKICEDGPVFGADEILWEEA